jgi:hypothetical protein
MAIAGMVDIELESNRRRLGRAAQGNKAGRRVRCHQAGRATCRGFDRLRHMFNAAGAVPVPALDPRDRLGGLFGMMGR